MSALCLLAAAASAARSDGDLRKRVRRHELVGARQSLRPAGGRRRVLLEDRAPRTTPPPSRNFSIALCGAAAPRLSPTIHAPPPLTLRSSRASQFEIAPGALELFSFKGDKDDLANSEKLKGHALKVRRRHERASTRRR